MRKVLPATLFAGLALAATACSSSGSSSASGNGVTGSSGDASSGSVASSSATGGGGGQARASAIAAKYEAAPTSINITTPLATAPPKGKTFVYLSCTDNEQCPTIGKGVTQAAQALGWNVKTLTYTSTDPATLVSAMQTALQYNPVAVAFTGPPYETWKGEVPAYQKAGVKIIPMFVGTAPVTSTILNQPGNPDYQSQTGKMIGNWFIADSGGKGHGLIVTIPAYHSLAPLVNGITQAVHQNCPACKLTTLNATIQQSNAGQIDSLVVTALQKDTSINYVLTTNAPFTAGLTNSLRAAGLVNKVKVAGFGYSGAEINDVKAGLGGAWAGAPLLYMGWNVMDEAARSVEHLPVPAQDPLMTAQLITKANVNTLKSTVYYEPPFDYQSQFKALWRVG